MSDVALAVEHLVATATKEARAEELRGAIDAVMKAFRPKDRAGARRAVATLGEALARSKGRAAQVLLLALGALVEAGAPPELAWPAIELGLARVLTGAGRFVQECADRAEGLGFLEALRRETEGVRLDFPRDHAAWQLVRAKCMAANACLTRSPALRKRAVQKGVLLRALRAARKLQDEVDEVRALSRIMRIVHDEPLLVIHVESRKGWRFVLHEVSTNVEVYVLLLDQIIGARAAGLLAARRPNPKAVATVRDPDRAPKGDVLLDVPFHTVAWTGLHPDGTLPDPYTSRETQHGIRLEGVPGEIPTFEGERVILLQGSVRKATVEVAVPYDALLPSLGRRIRVPAAEVARLLAKMARAAARLPRRKAGGRRR